MAMDESTLLREAVITDVRRTTQISWGAVFAGWVVSFGIALLFYQLGTAIGLTALDPMQQSAGAMARGFGIGTGIWVVLTWVVSLFLGGLFASRLAGRGDSTVGMLHGMTVWGIATLLTVVLGLMGAAGLFGAAANAVGGIAQAGTQAVQAGGGAGNVLRSTGLEATLKANIAQALSTAGVPQAEIRQAINQLGPNELGQISLALLQGNADQARDLLAVNTTLSSQQVNQVMGSVERRLPQFQQQAQQAAQQAANYAAAATWAIFISLVLALGAAIWGGMLGARYAARAYRTHAAEPGYTP